MGVLDHHNRAVHHGPHGNGNATQAHDVGVQAHDLHDNQAAQHGGGNDENRHQTAAQVQQEDGADQGDDEHFFEELLDEVVDGPLDERGAVVLGDHIHADRQPLLEVVDLGLDVADDFERVFAGAHDDDAADDFALAVGLRQSAANIGPQMHVGDVLQVDRRTAGCGLDDDPFEIINALLGPHPADRDAGLTRFLDLFRREGRKIAQTTDHVLCLGHLQHAPADVLVGHLDSLFDLRQRDVVCQQAVRIEHDLILAHEAADGRHFGHAFDGREFVAHVPILQAAQFR